MVLGVPKFRKFRKAVDNVSNVRNKTLIILHYLTAARVSDIITKTSPWEREHRQTRPFGTNLNFGMERIKRDKKFAVLLINVPLARRLGNPNLENFRVVALPCDLDFEPWSLDLLRYLSANKRLSFDLTRQRVGQIVKNDLGMLDSNVSPNKLRVYRISHLVKEYGFDQIDLMAYLGIPMKLSRELADLNLPDISPDLSWKRYFPKLLKPFFQNSK